MSTVIIPHLGPSIPPYIADCVHQLRLWNKDTIIIIVLDPEHEGVEFWTELQKKYDVVYKYTDRLAKTAAHQSFIASYTCNTKFRQGYWRYVVERFFYLEEVMRDMELANCITMEYDVLVYTNLTALTAKLAASHPTCRMVCDNRAHGHPGFFYIPTADAIGDICTFIHTNMHKGLSDMQFLATYADTYPKAIHYLPVITEARNKSISPRVTVSGIRVENPYYLSEDSEYLGVLFDSAVVGQYICGVDPRNMGGKKITQFVNAGALYKFTEMPFSWIQTEGLWQPQMDGRILATIHVHSKSLSSFVSDRHTVPTDDYVVDDVLRTLVRN